MDNSVRAWKIRMLRTEQMMEVWLVKLKKKEKTPMGLLCEESVIRSAGAAELSVINKWPEPLEQNLCFIGKWSVGAEEPLVIRKNLCSYYNAPLITCAAIVYEFVLSDFFLISFFVCLLYFLILYHFSFCVCFFLERERRKGCLEREDGEGLGGGVDQEET